MADSAANVSSDTSEGLKRIRLRINRVDLKEAVQFSQNERSLSADQSQFDLVE